jgi:hypothetical protein
MYRYRAVASIVFTVEGSENIVGKWFEEFWPDLKLPPVNPPHRLLLVLLGKWANLCDGAVIAAEGHCFAGLDLIEITREVGLGFVNVDLNHDYDYRPKVD